MIEAKAVWKKNYQVEVKARQFNIDVDEAPMFHGDDTGMMPTELFLSSVATCFCLALVYVARKQNVELSDLRVNVTGEVNTKNCTFTRLFIKVGSSLATEALEEMISAAKKYCYVSNTVNRSCPIEYDMISGV